VRAGPHLGHGRGSGSVAGEPRRAEQHLRAALRVHARLQRRRAPVGLCAAGRPGEGLHRAWPQRTGGGGLANARCSAQGHLKPYLEKFLAIAAANITPKHISVCQAARVVWLPLTTVCAGLQQRVVGRGRGRAEAGPGDEAASGHRAQAAAEPHAHQGAPRLRPAQWAPLTRARAGATEKPAGEHGHHHRAAGAGVPGPDLARAGAAGAALVHDAARAERGACAGQGWCGRVLQLDAVRCCPAQDSEKENAFRGLCLAVQLNPIALLPSFDMFCVAVSSWQNPPAHIVTMFREVRRAAQHPLVRHCVTGRACARARADPAVVQDDARQAGAMAGILGCGAAAGQRRPRRHAAGR
jgi:hypothetical protein